MGKVQAAVHRVSQPEGRAGLRDSLFLRRTMQRHPLTYAHTLTHTSMFTHVSAHAHTPPHTPWLMCTPACTDTHLHTPPPAHTLSRHHHTDQYTPPLPGAGPSAPLPASLRRGHQPGWSRQWAVAQGSERRGSGFFRWVHLPFIRPEHHVRTGRPQNSMSGRGSRPLISLGCSLLPLLVSCGGRDGAHAHAQVGVGIATSRQICPLILTVS